MDYEDDSEAVGDYFERRDRINEIMAGDKEHNKKLAEFIASQEAGVQFPPAGETNETAKSN